MKYKQIQNFKKLINEFKLEVSSKEDNKKLIKLLNNYKAEAKV